MTRESIIDALFALLMANPDTFATSGRRLKLWTQVTEQPALFLRHDYDEVPTHPTGIPPRIVVACEAWVYARCEDPDDIPEVVLNNLLDSIEISLRPAPGFERQTLGGLVHHCWLEGRIDIHPGDLDGQAIAVVPIKMLVPTIDSPQRQPTPTITKVAMEDGSGAWQLENTGNWAWG
jgi:hypothetical protein